MAGGDTIIEELRNEKRGELRESGKSGKRGRRGGQVVSGGVVVVRMDKEGEEG